MNLSQIFDLSDHNQNLDYLFDLALNLAQILPSPIPFLEIGTRAGGTTLLFIQAIIQSYLPRLMFSVDPYGNKPFRQGSSTLLNLYGESFWKQASNHIANICSSSNLVFQSHWKITSLDFIKIYDQITIWHQGLPFKGPFGLVYLDGDHDEDTISREIEFFAPRLYPKGMIIIDDSEHIIHSKKKTIRFFLDHAYSLGNRLFSDSQFLSEFLKQ